MWTSLRRCRAGHFRETELNPSIAKLTEDSFFECGTIGSIYAHSLQTVLIVLALTYASLEAWRMVQEYRLLNQAARVQQDKDSIAPCDSRRSDEKSDPWR